MAITKKIRFEVFKRDGFTCVYCGQSPPAVILEVDHIDPKSKGGKDDINNLITACFSCNRGKSNIPLGKIPPKISENLAILKEQEAQIKEYRKFIKRIESRTKNDIQDINNLYTETFPDWELSDKFINITLKRFLKLLPKHEIIEALQIALGKFSDDEDRSIKYFCGICWHKIRSISDPEE